MGRNVAQGLRSTTSRCGAEVTDSSQPQLFPPGHGSLDAGLFQCRHGGFLGRGACRQLLIHINQQHALAQRAPRHSSKSSALRPSNSLCDPRPAATGRSAHGSCSAPAGRPRIRTGHARPAPAQPPARGGRAAQSARSISSGATESRFRLNRSAATMASICVASVPMLSLNWRQSSSATEPRRKWLSSPKVWMLGSSVVRSIDSRDGVLMPPPAYAVPPTVKPSMRRVGWPTPTGTLWPSLPQVPTPLSSRHVVADHGPRASAHRDRCPRWWRPWTGVEDLALLHPERLAGGEHELARW